MTDCAATFPIGLRRALSGAKVLISAAALGFCLVYTAVAIGGNVTRVKPGPVVNGVLSVVSIGYLALVEGTLVAVLGANKEGHATDPWAARCVEKCTPGPRQDGFLVGAQSLVLCQVFILALLNIVDDPIPPGAQAPWGMEGVVLFLAQKGFIATFIAVVIGQQVLQLVAATNFVRWLHNPLAYVLVVLPAQAIDSLGLFHITHFIKYCLLTRRRPRDAGTQDINAADTPQLAEQLRPVPTLVEHDAQTMRQRVAWSCRVAVSTAIWVACAVCVFYAVGRGWTHPIVEAGSKPTTALVNTALLVVLWVYLCYCEAIQVSVAATLAWKRNAARGKGAAFNADAHPTAAANMELLFEDSQAKSFLMGRQVLVALLMFFLAGLTTVSPSARQSQGVTLFSLPELFQTVLLESGVVGIIFTVVGQLLCRVLAAADPWLYLSIPVLPRVTIYLCFATDKTGLFSVAYPLAWGINMLFGISPPALPVSAAADRDDDNSLGTSLVNVEMETMD
ncbi:hypothetical protein DIPPA_23497 [Diplonema papillatum]|nr:hypothetical protein DIPPA_23497 [Diplonema papillatum]|eukprot:gene8873-13756_t